MRRRFEALRKIAKRRNDAEVRTIQNSKFKVLEVKKKEYCH